MYKACIFDLDGTLASTLRSIVYFANEALRRCGYAPISQDDYRYLVGNGADRLMHRMLVAAGGKGNDTLENVNALRKIYDELYESDPSHLVTNYPGMQETVAALRKKGLRLAVLSNKPHNCTTAVVDFLFPKGTFDLCFGQHPGVACKPSPEGALLIAKRLGVKPCECLYIGDTNTDMQTGAAAGMDTAGALWGFRSRRELEENHAVYLAEKPEDIIRVIDCGKR
ncbi:MAG: HAD family hydrolase [Clostridiales bacterium]|nr:HAD family hydrolase [Clostridiales bacterium]